ncbi:carnitine acetyl transferase [Aspergillus luchuensis]|uniref:Carnitine acetyl transferase n=1 Tax=Aspergillus kawachii TaxID=1069201 RepID=A0A146FJI2_ASPKA|nr:carnitine acetyl transferase [Aspergillus luchuensis]
MSDAAARRPCRISGEEGTNPESNKPDGGMKQMTGGTINGPSLKIWTTTGLDPGVRETRSWAGKVREFGVPDTCAGAKKRIGNARLRLARRRLRPVQSQSERQSP